MSFIVGIQRQKLEDQIVARYEAIDFNQAQHAYLENESFWDFIFGWYELVRYYELSRDSTIGVHMLQLFTHCERRLRQAAHNRSLNERRRDRATDAIHQMTYYVNRMIEQAQRNGLANSKRQPDAPEGRIAWAEHPKPDDSAHLN